MAHSIPVGMEWIIPFQLEWNEAFHSGQNEKTHGCDKIVNKITRSGATNIAPTFNCFGLKICMWFLVTQNKNNTLY